MLLCGSGVLILLIRYHSNLVLVLFRFWYPYILFFFTYFWFNSFFYNDYNSLLINSSNVLFQSSDAVQYLNRGLSFMCFSILNAVIVTHTAMRTVKGMVSIIHGLKNGRAITNHLLRLIPICTYARYFAWLL